MEDWTSTFKIGNTSLASPRAGHWLQTVANKSYELSNHLGNVLETVTDRKIPTFTGSTFQYYTVDVISYSDYYPYGQQLPKRRGGDYRYGFNDMEADDEIKNDGNSYDFGARMYDPRVGRWLSVDPLEANYPDISAYSFAANSPLIFIDPDGKKFINPYTKTLEDTKIAMQTLENNLNDFLEANPNASKKDIKKFKQDSHYFAVQEELKTAQSNYDDVEDFIYTLKTLNFEEYEYFETLKDGLGQDVDISTYIIEEGNPKFYPGSAHTEGFSYQPEENNKVTPLSSATGIRIYLNRTYKYSNPDGSIYKVVHGNNFESFSNELGDVKYFYENVHDTESLNFWKETTGFDDNPSDNKGYEDPKGAGEYSRMYEAARLSEFKNYKVNPAAGETKDIEKNKIIRPKK